MHAARTAAPLFEREPQVTPLAVCALELAHDRRALLQHAIERARNVRVLEADGQIVERAHRRPG